MISKSRINLIRSMHIKKSRDKTGLFLCEGDKICKDLLLSDFNIYALYFTKEWGNNNLNVIQKSAGKMELMELSPAELKKMSLLNSPNQVLALVKQKKKEISLESLKNQPVILLDNIQDPGNLGTIIRTADWLGIQTIISSLNTADIYNPKVIQSAMGSVFRINYFKENLEMLLTENRNKNKKPVFATVLGGKNLFRQKLGENPFFLFGNEANGVSLSLQSLADKQITIPQRKRTGSDQQAESLNVAIAAGIVMAEYTRQNQLS